MEWKDLEIGNLPPDILTGDYEWEVRYGEKRYIKSLHDSIIDVLITMTEHNKQYRYRKPEPKRVPTHEEIWTKIWKIGPTWQKVHKYKNGLYYFSDMETGCSRDFFTGRESADDIPPEE